MSTKYQCPLCDEVYDEKYEAEDCIKECAFETYSVVEIDTTEDIKGNLEDFVGKCETCRNCDSEGRTFADCPLHNSVKLRDGCDAYVPDTLEFGARLETLWNNKKEARA